MILDIHFGLNIFKSEQYFWRFFLKEPAFSVKVHAHNA